MEKKEERRNALAHKCSLDHGGDSNPGDRACEFEPKGSRAVSPPLFLTDSDPVAVCMLYPCDSGGSEELTNFFLGASR